MQCRDRFQPSASLRAGCNVACVPLVWIATVVSTLSQPPGWLQHSCADAGGGAGDVSTLSQPPGWLQRGQLIPILPLHCRSSFNPQPASGLAATPIGRRLVSCHVSVSTLSQPPGWLQHGRRILSQHRCVYVSTLSQPPGWLQLPHLPPQRRGQRFQPSASLRAGCNVTGYISPSWGALGFQPSASLRAGCNMLLSEYNEPIIVSFNPQPASGLAATRTCLDRTATAGVSTLSQPPGWLQP